MQRQDEAFHKRVMIKLDTVTVELAIVKNQLS